MPTINTEPKLNKNFRFDLGNNSSSRAFFCCLRHKKDSYEEIGSRRLLATIKRLKYRQVLHPRLFESAGGRVRERSGVSVVVRQEEER
jgi:hypothetical protein